MTDDTTDMTDTGEAHTALMTLPEARATRSRWFGLVWAIPLAALLIVVFLGIRGLAHRGIDVVVSFDAADGVAVGDTKVIYQGIEAGHVTHLDIAEDGKRVDVTLRLDPRAQPALNTSTLFWLVGQKPDLSDISSVKAALVGVTIGMAPGVGGTPTRHFEGLSQPPVVLPGTPGTLYTLTSAQLGALRPGSTVFFRGQEAGKVTAVSREATNFRIGVFINAPYDRMVGRDTRFWVASPLQVRLADGGIQAGLDHPGAILSGAIELDVDNDAPALAQSPANTNFALYEGKEAAIAGPVGPQIDYRLRFNGPGGDLAVGAPVRLMGFTVGRVQSVRLGMDEKSGALQTSVQAVLFPLRLNIVQKDTASADEWRRATDALVGRLVAQGYRARLTQKPALVGSLVVDLAPAGGPPAAPGRIGRTSGTTAVAGGPMEIPTLDAAGGIDELTGQASRILAKVDALPIEAIGRNVRGITAKLDTLLSSPQIASSLQHLDSTLTQVDQMVSEVRPQVGPLVRKLNEAAGEVAGTASAARAMLSGEGAPQDASLPAAIGQLSDAAQSIRALADYLGRHPEALLKGKAKDGK
ncbi:MAG: MlaD family protein [Pseudomonadota bacterium]